MKIMKYIVPALLGGMLTLQSCEHFLDTKPTETYSEELVWGSRSTADAFVLRTYPDILGLYHDFWGDDQITLNTILRQSCPGEARDLINREHDFGFNKFSIIRRCNLIIEQLPPLLLYPIWIKKNWLPRENASGYDLLLSGETLWTCDLGRQGIASRR